MPRFRRYRVVGGTYFFTTVTHERRPILTTDLGRRCLREAFTREMERAPFDLFAIVLLPDHLHAIWTLPHNDADYSTRWCRIKESFTRAYLGNGGQEGATTTNRVRHRQRAIWQHRFWEHHCRDEDDTKRCLDYLHWNPVKHGLVRAVKDYAWSSFHKHVKCGEYDIEWGSLDTVVKGVAGAEWE